MYEVFKKYSVLFLVFMLFIIDIILVFTLYQNKRFNNNLGKKVQKVEDAYNINAEYLKNLKLVTILQLKTEDTKLLDRIKISFNDKTVTFQDTSIWKQKIVLRFTELNCNICVDENIELLKKIIQEIGEKNVLIFASFNNLRSLYSFKVNHKLGIQIFNIDELNLPIEQANTPYFFMLDSVLRMRKVFIPQKELPELSEIYVAELLKSFQVYNHIE